jgi:hypothetical protein
VPSSSRMHLLWFLKGSVKCPDVGKLLNFGSSTGVGMGVGMGDEPRSFSFVYVRSLNVVWQTVVRAVSRSEVEE